MFEFEKKAAGNLPAIFLIVLLVCQPNCYFPTMQCTNKKKIKILFLPVFLLVEMILIVLLVLNYAVNTMPRANYLYSKIKTDSLD